MGGRFYPFQADFELKSNEFQKLPFMSIDTFRGGGCTMLCHCGQVDFKTFDIIAAVFKTQLLPLQSWVILSESDPPRSNKPNFTELLSRNIY